jgi:hypothetical protein
MGNSTEGANLTLVEKLYENLNDKKISAVLLLDISKAFDSVNHEILLNKLKNLGITGIELQ